MSSMYINNPSLTELPDTIIFEILLKLPIKYVIGCRLVCKSLCKLTFDPWFGRNYLANPPLNVLVCTEIGSSDKDEEYYLLEIGRNCDNIMRIPFHPKALSFHTATGGNLLLMGSCNGLLGFVQVIYPEHSWSEETVYIVNTLLGEFTRLPKVECPNDEFQHYFGCTRDDNKYKVLRVTNSFQSTVFTIGVDDEWTSVNDNSFLSADDSLLSEVGFNGVIHVLMWDQSVIFGFDVEEEKVKLISLPVVIAKNENMYSLVVLNDKLCYTENHCDGGMDIWVMKEYGIGESWSKEIKLRSWIPSELQDFMDFFPVTASRDGDILLRTDIDPYSNHLLYLDPQAKSCRAYKIHGAEGAFFFVDPYVPRFFSHVPTCISPLNSLGTKLATLST